MGKYPTGTGRRLEATGAPAAVEIQSAHRRLRDNRTGVGAGIDDAPPVTQHAHAAENRKQLDDRREIILDDRETAPLPVTSERIDSGTDNEFALVGLTHIAVHRV